jgi:hypothetical protein
MIEDAAYFMRSEYESILQGAEWVLLVPEEPGVRTQQQINMGRDLTRAKKSRDDLEKFIDSLRTL